MPAPRHEERQFVPGAVNPPPRGPRVDTALPAEFDRLLRMVEECAELCWRLRNAIVVGHA